MKNKKLKLIKKTVQNLQVVELEKIKAGSVVVTKGLTNIPPVCS